MVPLCVLAGVAIAPLFASGNQLVGDVAPPGALTEAYTWLVTAIVVGVAVGNAVAGVLVEAADWRVSFLVGAGCGAVGSLLAIARRETLSPVAARAA
jgi:MFS family permease